MIIGTIAASMILGQRGWGAALADPKLKGAIVGAVVTDTNGKVLFELNATTRVMPASNQKLISAAFALKTFGAQKTWKTQIWLDSMVALVSAEGDPLLTPERLAAAKEQFAKNSVVAVQLWQAYQNEVPDSWQVGDLPNRYAPVIHALTFEKAGVELWFTGKGPVFKPYTPRIEIVENDFIKPKFAYNAPLAQLLVREAPADQSKAADTLSDPDPSSSVLDFLAGGTSYKREDLSKRPEVNREPDITLESPPLSEIAKTCLQKSDNCLAEHLLTNATNGQTKNLADWLTSIGWERNSFKVADGSGLSRKNNVTAANIAKLLKWSYDQPTRQIWLDSLARPGVGTLANRLKGTTFFGKTGTLDMVSSLSGYVKCKDGSLKIVSVIVNHHGCTTGEAQSCIDRFIENVRG
jgi:serine-type D-Ala-D-Ala carboxypeptidase/endopeptidase (penicillin-binding protein 4)